MNNNNWLRVDLDTKTLAHTGHKFIENGLNAYVLARYAAELGYSIAPETYQEARNIPRDRLYILHAEDVALETCLAMASARPQRYFQELAQLFALEAWFPDLIRLIGVPAGPPGHHDELDAFTHTMMVLERTAWIPITEEDDLDVETIRFSALTHDLGKGLTPSEEWPRHLDHEKIGVHLVQKFYDRLGLSEHLKNAAVVACEDHLKAHRFLDISRGKMVDLIRRADNTELKAEGLALVAICDALGRDSVHKSTEGPAALLAVANACRNESGYPVPKSLRDGDVDLYIRNQKGLAIIKALTERGYLGQSKPLTDKIS